MFYFINQLRYENSIIKLKVFNLKFLIDGELKDQQRARKYQLQINQNKTKVLHNLWSFDSRE